MYFIILFYISSYFVITFCCTGCFITSPSTAGLSHREPASAVTYSDSYRDHQDDKDIHSILSYMITKYLLFYLCGPE
jgi:hypothetical protein